MPDATAEINTGTIKSLPHAEAVTRPRHHGRRPADKPTFDLTRRDEQISRIEEVGADKRTAQQRLRQIGGYPREQLVGISDRARQEAAKITLAPDPLQPERATNKAESMRKLEVARMQAQALSTREANAKSNAPVLEKAVQEQMVADKLMSRAAKFIDNKVGSGLPQRSKEPLTTPPVLRQKPQPSFLMTLQSGWKKLTGLFRQSEPELGS